MYDYIFRWNNVQDAKADFIRWGAELGLTPAETQDWALSFVIPDMKAWRPSQDTIVDGRVVHQYLTGWFALFGLQRKRQALLDEPALQFCIDRTAWITRVPPYIVRNNIGTLQDVAFEPQYTGCNYPLGGLT